MADAPPPSDDLVVRSADEAPAAPLTLRARMTGWLRDLAVLVVGGAAVWFGAGWLRAPSLPDAAPALAGVALDGTEVDLTALRGKTVVVNFWATWCPPCRAEMPMLVEYAAEHPDTPVVFVAMDDRVDPVRAYVDQQRIPAARVLHADRALRSAWDVSTLPTTVVVGPDGEVRAAHSGMLLAPQLWWMTR